MKHICSPGNEEAFQELMLAHFHWVLSRNSLSYCSVQETSIYQGSTAWHLAALCRTLRKQRGSFWWPPSPGYHNQLLAAPFYQALHLHARCTSSLDGRERGACAGIPSCCRPTVSCSNSAAHKQSSKIIYITFNSLIISWTLLSCLL